MNTALYDPASGEIYIHSEMLGEGTVPEDLDWEDCIEIPHRKKRARPRPEPGLPFCGPALPEKENFVVQLFKNRGAYARLKQLLDTMDLLEAWYEFEDAALRNALRKWWD
jgi:hypothetical protein